MEKTQIAIAEQVFVWGEPPAEPGNPLSLVELMEDGPLYWHLAHESYPHDGSPPGLSRSGCERWIHAAEKLGTDDVPEDGERCRECWGEEVDPSPSGRVPFHRVTEAVVGYMRHRDDEMRPED